MKHLLFFFFLSLFSNTLFSAEEIIKSHCMNVSCSDSEKLYLKGVEHLRSSKYLMESSIFQMGIQEIIKSSKGDFLLSDILISAMYRSCFEFDANVAGQTWLYSEDKEKCVKRAKDLNLYAYVKEVRNKIQNHLIQKEPEACLISGLSNMQSFLFEVEDGNELVKAKQQKLSDWIMSSDIREHYLEAAKWQAYIPGKMDLVTNEHWDRMIVDNQSASISYLSYAYHNGSKDLIDELINKYPEIKINIKSQIKKIETCL